MTQPRGPGGLRADFALLAVAGFWGLTFPFGKLVLASLPPFTYLAVRFGLAALMLLAIVPRRSANLRQRDWVWGVGVGVVLFLGYALQTVGLRLTTASQSGFITGLSVAIVPVLAALWERRLPRLAVLAGVASATAGLVLLTLNQTLQVKLGDILTLGCAFSFALHIVLVGRLTRALDSLTFAAAQVVPVAVLSALAAIGERPAAALDAAPGSVWTLIVFMAATATMGAYLIQVWAQRFTTASHTGLMFTFEPVAAALAAYLILGEVLTGRQAVGAALILGGILMAELGGRRGGTSRRAPQ